MKINNKTHIVVFGNEKGGVGKTTFAIHCIISLLYKGYKVCSIDVDSRQHSLTSYINNRIKYNGDTFSLPIPEHFLITESEDENIQTKKEKERIVFENIFLKTQTADYLIIDTPGNDTNLSRIAHSYADTIVTPINDSFVDLDVIASYSGIGEENISDLRLYKPSTYSHMVWEQKISKLQRDKLSIKWFVARNRLTNIDSKNKRFLQKALEVLSKKLSFRVLEGFKERVIFKELFLKGITLLDIANQELKKNFSLSHIAARQELRELVDSLDLYPK